VLHKFIIYITLHGDKMSSDDQFLIQQYMIYSFSGVTSLSVPGHNALYPPLGPPFHGRIWRPHWPK